MKAKIDLEKFISSMLGYAEDNCEETMLDYLHSALQDQGLEYKDGEIVEIAHEPEFKLEIGKWYKCILTPVVHKHFTVGKVYECELEGCLADDTDEDRIVDLDLECFRPATDDEIPKEQEERENLRKRYERISNSDWFKKTHVGISIGEQPLEEDVVGMGELGKVWNEQAIISRLDRIIELLERPIIMPFSQPIQPLQPIYYDPNKDKVYCSTASTEGGEE